LFPLLASDGLGERLVRMKCLDLRDAARRASTLTGSPCRPQPWQFPHFPLPGWLLLAAAPGILAYRYRARKMGLRPFRRSFRGGFPEFPRFPQFPLPDWLIRAAPSGILSHRYRALKMGFRPLRPFRQSFHGGFPEFPHFPQFPLPDWPIRAAPPGILAYRYRAPKRGFRPLRPFRRSFGGYGRADGGLRRLYRRRPSIAPRLLRRRC
jgi:hypothetical protein